MNENEKLEAILREIVDELATRYDSHLCGSMAKWAAEVVVSTFDRYGVKVPR